MAPTAKGDQSPFEVKTASSLTEVLKTADDIRRRWSSLDTEEVWFRGCKNRTYALLPGIYRDANVDFDEETLVNHFRCLAPMFPECPALNDDWDWFIHCQHYGLPTRLLDWSESLGVALYFAIESGHTTGRIPNTDSDGARVPCVWMIDPAHLNTLTCKNAEVIVPRGDFSKHWLPGECKKGRSIRFAFEHRRFSNSLPISIYPRRGNRRIAAQQGVFTVHGSDRIALETVLIRKQGKLARIARIDITDNLAQLRHDLRLLGIYGIALFPELPRLAEHVTTACSRR